jgi:site-specific recombinase XerD
VSWPWLADYNAISQDIGMQTDDFRALLDSWELSLRAERKSPHTIHSYLDGCRAFVRWAETNECPAELDAATLNRFVVSLLDDGKEASTAKSRHLAVRRFSAWAAAEGEIPADLIAGLRAPKVDVKVIEALEPEEVRALLDTAKGKELHDLRDAAIIWLMVTTTARCAEVLALELDDVNLRAGTAVLRKAKGGRGRTVGFGPECGRALDRYLRARRRHRRADQAALWVGEDGRGFGYQGLYSALTRRAERAGIPNFNPHRLRNTAAVAWLDAGGSESGLMHTAGWTSYQMLARYTRASAERRAIEESRKLGLEDL